MFVLRHRLVLIFFACHKPHPDAQWLHHLHPASISRRITLRPCVQAGWLTVRLQTDRRSIKLGAQNLAVTWQEACPLQPTAIAFACRFTAGRTHDKPHVL